MKSLPRPLLRAVSGVSLLLLLAPPARAQPKTVAATRADNVASGLTASSSRSDAPVPDSNAAPVGAVRESRWRGPIAIHRWPNGPLLSASLLVLIGTYTGSAIAASVSNNDADKQLYYPVAGPWLDLHRRHCADNVCSNGNAAHLLVVGSGVLQGVAAFGTLLSLVIPQTSAKEWYEVGDRRLQFSAGLAPGALGVGASGRF